MGIIRDILSEVDNAVASVAHDGFVQSAGQVGGVISVGAAALIGLIGVNAVTQIRPVTHGAAFAFGMKVGLVGLFAKSWANFAVIYDVITTVPDNIGARILNLTGSGNEAGVYASLDAMVNRITAYGDAIGDNAGWVFGAMLGAIFFVLSALFAAVTAGVIAYSKIVFTLMIVLAPFMLTASLFKPTLSLFEAWSRATVGYALMPVAAAGAAGVIVAIADNIAAASVDPGAVATVSLILPFLVILLLSAGIMAAIPSIATNLTGVISIASNAIGLVGLARQGVIDTGAYGFGGAGRMATGKTPAQLRRAVSDGVIRAGAVLRASPAQALARAKSFRAAAARNPRP